MTALSNEEVIYKDVPGAFYHIKYLLKGQMIIWRLLLLDLRHSLVTLLSLLILMMKDTRFNRKNVVLPIVNKLIPIIGDEHADPEFGTGIVKITPAHDPNDFEVGNRHNLERIIVINPDGTMNENALVYNGLDRFLCRKKLVEDLKIVAY